MTLIKNDVCFCAAPLPPPPLKVPSWLSVRRFLVQPLIQMKGSSLITG